jgi:hypothetical protein
MPEATSTWLNKIAKEKTKLLQDMFDMEPIHVDVLDPKTKKNRPHVQGEDIIYIWDKIYGTDKMMHGIVVDTVTGPSTPGKDYVDDINANPAMPYQQLRALVGDGGKWKWPEIWKNLVSYLLAPSWTVGINRWSSVFSGKWYSHLIFNVACIHRICFPDVDLLGVTLTIPLIWERLKTQTPT